MMKSTACIWRLLFCCKNIFRWTKRKSQSPKKTRKYLNNEFVNCLNFATHGSKSFKNHIEPANLTKKDWEHELFRLFRPKGKGCDFVFAPIFFRNIVLSPFWNFGGFKSSRWHGSNRKNEIYNLRLVPEPPELKTIWKK